MKRRRSFTSLNNWLCSKVFEKLIVTQLVKKSPFLGSLPFSQKLAIGPYPAQDESGPTLTPNLFKTNPNIIFPSISRSPK
jgi:hypothetical protein